MNGVDDFTSIPSVERITALEEPVLRNLQITQSYADMSAAMARLISPGANWCTFATWASKQAGQTMRGEDLLRTMEHWLGSEPAAVQALTEIAALAGKRATPTDVRHRLWSALDFPGAVQRAADSVGRGNRKVYAEIGREFARFLADFPPGAEYDAAQLDAFCAQLLPGDPPEGQRYLQQAFRHYYLARFESNPKERTEWVLLANLEIGWHEQTRLQPEITAALNASLSEPAAFASRLLDTLFPGRGRLIQLVWWFLRLTGRRARMEAAIRRFYDAACRRIRLFLTEHLMTLSLPGERLRLGRDLPQGFAVSLQRLSNPELLKMMKVVDITPDSMHSTGASDWAALPERMHFIADLFRRYHERTELFQQPFTPEQTARIKAGETPPV
ncbi:MAG: hypothetical protein KF852_18215 [Saprospiraceae bacterium]|nr:hypothetical protein [Saprospiraceae bacterium]